MKDKEFLQWLYDRLIQKHKEHHNFDYMRQLKNIIDNVDENVITSNGTSNNSNSTKPRSFIIRKEGDLSFEEGLIEFWLLNGNAIAVSVCKGFEILRVERSK